MTMMHLYPKFPKAQEISLDVLVHSLSFRRCLKKEKKGIAHIAKGKHDDQQQNKQPENINQNKRHLEAFY